MLPSPPQIPPAHAAPSEGITWLHLIWGELIIDLEARWTDGVTVTKRSLGGLSVGQAWRAAAFARDYRVVVLEAPAYRAQAIVFPHRNVLRNLLRLPFAVRFVCKYALLSAFLARSARPLLIFDLQDSAGITARFLPFIRRSVACYKRELPKCVPNAFQHTERFAIEVWRTRGRYAAEIAKLRPLSIGAGWVNPPAFRAREKDCDVFWAGTVENSPVRERGVQLLKELAAEGLRVVCHEGRMEKEAFLDQVARSWLTFSPDGNGWQCWRTLEAGALGSIPLMSYPSVWQDAPFRDGETCFYYDPEGDHLKQVIRAALLDKARLRAISAAAHTWVTTAHTEAAVYHRHLAALGGAHDSISSAR